ncbi:hypothetical protein Tco_1459571 [Tanacetum coccineum]
MGKHSRPTRLRGRHLAYPMLIIVDCPDCEDSQHAVDIMEQEVDINKKTENQAKMTKLSMEWKRLCKIKAKVQKCQSQSQYRRISSQTGAGTEEYY